MVFRINEEWINSYPARKKKRRIHYVSTTTTTFLVGLFMNSLSFWVVGAALILFYTVNLWLEPSADRMNALFRAMTVEAKDDGLHQESLDMSGLGKLEENTISTVTPWADISLKRVSKKGENVKKIILVNHDLPFGARRMTLENYDGMNELLSQIKARLGRTATLI